MRKNGASVASVVKVRKRTAFSPPYSGDGVQFRLTTSSRPRTTTGAARPNGIGRMRPESHRARHTPPSSRPSATVTSNGAELMIACSLKSPT